MAIIIDSSVFVTIERRGQTLDDLLSYITDQPATLAAITASELLAGAHLAGSMAHRLRQEAYVEDILERLIILPFDLNVARIHAQIWAQLRTAGQMVSAHDLIIGCTALAYGYPVLTYNLRDFNRIPELDVRQPNW
jgi:tRNA(fMet)-specific endonuclease VapC